MINISTSFGKIAWEKKKKKEQRNKNQEKANKRRNPSYSLCHDKLIL